MPYIAQYIVLEKIRSLNEFLFQFQTKSEYTFMHFFQAVTFKKFSKYAFIGNVHIVKHDKKPQYSF